MTKGKQAHDMLDHFLQSLRDARDVLRRACSPAELAKAFVPSSWLSRDVLNEEPAHALPQPGLTGDRAH